ncbi:MAG: F0F1 ATP synthase subunit delta [Ignavibacteria bacterium]|jgi:F-type H+-transporting ATPase subunit delta|nr:F0F1 ATP synthase subunit delta [Ignavibacteria bacterium]MCU7503092.1 F0F1 ATP synthase subunit delta [Ignavibacteria bacterium]MCU7516488.1 F0F1 ATP synthase subunit delta [Ignavibacteria bacterium]
MSNYNISSRYANALMQLASEKDLFEQISADMEVVFNTLSSSREFQMMLISPVVKVYDKEQVLLKVFENRISHDSLNFLQFIVRKNRENLLFNIVRQFLSLRDKKLGVVNAEVLSASEFTDEQKSKLTKKLEEYTRKKVRLSLQIDRNLLGGFIVRIEDTVIDASLDHQLELLKSQFMKGDSSLN